MEGLIMYWFSWCAWIVVTFLVPKSMNRYKWSMFILFFIVFYSIDVTVPSGQLNLGFIWLSVGCYRCFQLQTKQKLFTWFLSVWLITAVYAGFVLWSIYDPIILFAEKQWIVAGLIFCVGYLIMKPSFSRIIVVTLGMLHGEVLVHLIFVQIWGSYEIGDGIFFDALAATQGLFCAHLILKIGLEMAKRLTENSSHASQSL
ncbi:YphA family membrane protein [Alkalicoccobacillus murimartini]|uniref:Uncharacterized protein n=1 Tax=Alkalicoccobacillus murimartini TaxID=171685 RepID=A0ABT9YFA8_9BACI|nr:hypothetical protein [Alkalicoccobacillus murimartini]MDQ0205902.1 hypothetical protein [Alkalicoccobacillus murimartini]